MKRVTSIMTVDIFCVHGVFSMNDHDATEEDALTLDDLTRRSVLRATGGAAALSLGVGSAAGASDEGSPVEQVGTAGIRSAVDPVFGFAAMGPNPCRDRGDDCLQAFPQQIRPTATVDMNVGIQGLVFGAAESDALSGETTTAINDAVADGSLEGDALGGTVTVGNDQVPVAAIAQALVDTVGFHFDPAGLRVQPGDLVLFNAASPDHSVAAFHEGHGRQNRVPRGVGPLSSPLVPVGGFWLALFEEPGVYDLYCPPHGPFGMVMRLVVWDGNGAVPELDIGPPGRPPAEENALPGILGGLDPNVPSSAEALESAALSPENIASEGEVSWHEVVEEHRTA
jgi:plastocyanin